jgi:hypothetical protein
VTDSPGKSGFLPQAEIPSPGAVRRSDAFGRLRVLLFGLAIGVGLALWAGDPLDGDYTSGSKITLDGFSRTLRRNRGACQIGPALYRRPARVYHR